VQEFLRLKLIIKHSLNEFYIKFVLSHEGTFKDLVVRTYVHFLKI